MHSPFTRLAMIVLLTSAGAAHAVQFDFTGHVGTAIGLTGVAVGDPVSGTWLADHDALASCTRVVPGTAICIESSYPQAPPAGLSMTVEALVPVSFEGAASVLEVDYVPADIGPFERGASYRLAGELTSSGGAFDLTLTTDLPPPGWSLEPPPSELDTLGGSVQLILRDDGDTVVGLIRITIDAIDPVDAAPIAVRVDLKPDSNPSPFNPHSRGETTLAIFGSPACDPSTIDLATLTVNGQGEGIVALNGNGKPKAALVDFDGDGIDDLELHLETQAIGLVAVLGRFEVTFSDIFGAPYAGEHDTISDPIVIAPTGEP